MLETITTKLAVGISGLSLIAGCETSPEPLVEECCKNLSCNSDDSSYTCEKSEDRSTSFNSYYHCIKVDQNNGTTYNVCCGCRPLDPIEHDKGI